MSSKERAVSGLESSAAGRTKCLKPVTEVAWDSSPGESGYPPPLMALLFWGFFHPGSHCFKGTAVPLSQGGQIDWLLLQQLERPSMFGVGED